MLRIAYGEANFDNLRRNKGLFVDKTQFISRIERVEKFFFIRPRRFGKSLWLSVLQAYYDIHKKEQFDELFKGLYIHNHPTELKNSYLILKFDFSGLDTSSSNNLRYDFDNRVRDEAERFFYEYQSFFPETREANFFANLRKKSAAQTLSLIRLETQKHRQKVYIFIDEYDHFANKLAAEGKESFVNDIISETGYVRNFFEQMKTGSGEGVFERFFITGVSPIMLDELASGFNIMNNMVTHPTFNEMLGFTSEEVEAILNKVPQERFTIKSKDDVFRDMAEFYNGYLFSEDTNKKVFNPDMVLYFLQYFHEIGYPKEILDLNIKTDYNKLKGLIVGSSGKENLKKILDEINVEDGLTFQLVQRFTFANRLKDYELKSLLFFFGLLTMEGKPNRFVVPNHVIRTLHWEYLQNYLEENGVEFNINALHSTIAEMSEFGKMDCLKKLAIDFFQNKLSSYDFNAMSEKHIKFMFISYFTLSKLYNVISEREISGSKRIDLLFEANPAYYHYIKHNFIMEFKYIYKNDSVAKAKDKREKAIQQAKEYYDIYRRDFKQFGRELHSIALIVSHNRNVDLIEVAGF